MLCCIMQLHLVTPVVSASTSSRRNKDPTHTQRCTLKPTVREILCHYCNSSQVNLHLTLFVLECSPSLFIHLLHQQYRCLLQWRRVVFIGKEGSQILINIDLKHLSSYFTANIAVSTSNKTSIQQEDESSFLTVLGFNGVSFYTSLTSNLGLYSN